MNYEQFKAAGIAYPAQRKDQLVKKFEAEGIELRIESRTQSYVLHAESD